MGTTIAGFFQTRRDAEMAVERLVQEHGIARPDVFIEPESSANTAGTKAAGADAQSGHPGVAKDGEPKLGGRIRVSVDVNGEAVETVQSAFHEFGASDVTKS